MGSLWRIPIHLPLLHVEQVALAIAAVENTVTHQRLCTLSSSHPADASRYLHGLVEKGLSH